MPEFTQYETDDAVFGPMGPDEKPLPPWPVEQQDELGSAMMVVARFSNSQDEKDAIWEDITINMERLIFEMERMGEGMHELATRINDLIEKLGSLETEDE